MVSRDYRILYNIDCLKVAPDYELYITSFHKMLHIYQYCCIDFGKKYPMVFNEPKERVKQREYGFKHYYVSEIEDDMKLKKFITKNYGSVDAWLTTTIESTINLIKNKK